jgi:hypothetical protein
MSLRSYVAGFIFGNELFGVAFTNHCRQLCNAVKEERRVTAGVFQKYATGWTIFKHQVDNRNMKRLRVAAGESRARQ